MQPIDVLRHHVTGAVERGEAEPITAVPSGAAHVSFSAMAVRYLQAARLHDVSSRMLRCCGFDEFA